ncbi:site-specific integrase [Amycolatopsis taiwanensis]|uniref:Tyr recombinase domain-containing protein n=1 Tax=Amycolatopsis taiwanensis TaxID=342230 RepID=A0A9W6QYA4_9PSEU|nr:site-specific integrase [Amycolatopsis taiwanensis]GLY64753.1 hypothetical protein Atai01_13720 [Amycolatopsis taiwanensis]
MRGKLDGQPTPVPANPVRKRRRGRRARTLTPEKIWATPEQVVRIAEQAATLGGRIAYLLIITAAWTGCRWGELTGLHRSNVDLDHAVLTIGPWMGGLHESSHHRRLGPPKTPSAARCISLPPFLVDLLHEHLETQPFEFVFTTPSGVWPWRSTFIRRVFRPAVDGNRHGLHPIRRGLTFHGLRHSHKTWLIADNIPEIAQARRLGHRLDNRIIETYSHVAPELEHRLLTALEHRWHAATHPDPPPAPEPTTPTRPGCPPLRRNMGHGRQTPETPAQPMHTLSHTCNPPHHGAPEMPHQGQPCDNHDDHTRSFTDTRKPLRPAPTAESKGFATMWS